MMNRLLLWATAALAGLLLMGGAVSAASDDWKAPPRPARPLAQLVP